jgi:hypothetical protein
MVMMGGDGCRVWSTVLLVGVWCGRGVWCIVGGQIYFLLDLFSYDDISATIFVSSCSHSKPNWLFLFTRTIYTTTPSLNLSAFQPTALYKIPLHLFACPSNP